MEEIKTNKLGIELIAEERKRQIEEEGYSWRHDDEETTHQLSDAAIVYATPAPLRYEIMHKWPWDKKFFKPDTTYTYDGRIRELTKAGALICAEIDRLIRLKGINGKFDPETLKPFDKVIVRNGEEWQCDFFSHMSGGEIFNKCCIGFGDKTIVIPYNNETKHLVGTTEEAPEYYRYWEE